MILTSYIIRPAFLSFLMNVGLMMAYSGRNLLPTFELINYKYSCDRRSTYFISCQYCALNTMGCPLPRLTSWCRTPPDAQEEYDAQKHSVAQSWATFCDKRVGPGLFFVRNGKLSRLYIITVCVCVCMRACILTFFNNMQQIPVSVIQGFAQPYVTELLP
jgi:hypothetical protein